MAITLERVIKWGHNPICSRISSVVALLKVTSQHYMVQLDLGFAFIVLIHMVLGGSGYEKYGFNRDGDCIVYQEWAPAAA